MTYRGAAPDGAPPGRRGPRHQPRRPTARAQRSVFRLPTVSVPLGCRGC